VHRFRLTPTRAGIPSALFAILLIGHTAIWGGKGIVDLVGWALLFLIGLCWAVLYVERESRRLEALRSQRAYSQRDDYDDYFRPNVILGGATVRKSETSNPLDPSAWYYAIGRPRLLQSFLLLFIYCVFFAVLYFLAHLNWGPSRENDGYDLPAGGGSDTIQASSVKVQKVIKKKYVINPYSSIIFAAPPIDKIDVKLMEETQNRYVVGQGDGSTGEGDGDGSGFGSGTGKGKAAFVRLKHADRGWDRNFGIGGDRNMLAEYHARTKQKVADETEYIDIDQLPRFPAQKAPPLLYICGNQSLPLDASAKKILRQYLTEQHGMILGDNHGGPGFHQSFIANMNEITGVTAVAIPRDDRIHQRPYSLPMLPVVVAHGGTLPLGWKLDGRWVVYYHPGALSDAWRDDHAGIKKDVYESCYQLGVNVIFYSLSEKNKWLKSQRP
jgi:Domain of unknown function (DUF4159)